MDIGIGGRANSTGFEIKWEDLRVSSKDYKNKPEFLSMGIALIFWLIVCLFSRYLENIYTGMAGFKDLSNSRDFFSLCCQFGIIFVLIISISLPKRLKQWHACEHRVAGLIEKNSDLTLENLRRTSCLNPRCGSEVISSIFLASLVTYLLLNLTCIPIIFCRLILAASYFFLIVLPVSSPIQYLFTKEPIEEQLEEALRVAKEFKEKLNQERR